MTLASRFAVPEAVLYRQVEEEAVVLELRSGQYFGLDEMAARMFSLIAEHGMLSRVYDQLLAEYEVEPVLLQEDLLAFADHLLRHDLVRIDAPDVDPLSDSAS